MPRLVYESNCRSYQKFFEYLGTVAALLKNGSAKTCRLVTAVAGLMVGVSVYIGLGLALERGETINERIRDVRLVETPATVVDRSLHVDISAPMPTNCTRLVQVYMWRDIDGARFYYPLGTALHGEGYTNSRPDVTLVVALPPGLAPGDYTYVQRSNYTCTWFGGFIMRRLTNQTPGQTVHIS